jgi:hypothetical protein
MLRQKFRIAIAIFGLWCAFLGWGFSSPIGSSPDDDFHIGSAWCAGGFELGVCEEIASAEVVGETSVKIPVKRNFCYVFDSAMAGNCESNNSPGKMEEFRANNGLYPAQYYSFLHLFVDEDAVTSIYLMRAVNSTIAAIFLFLALLLAPQRFRIGIASAWTFTIVPLALFVIPSINPSSWTYIGLATNWVFQLSAMHTGERSKRLAKINWLMYFSSAALCIFSRSDAAIYVLVSSILILGVSYKLEEKFIFRNIFPVAAVSIISLLSVMSTNQGKNFDQSTGGSLAQASDLNRFIYNIVHLIEIPAGAFGFNWGLGWLDTALPPIVGIVGVSVFAIVSMASLADAQKWRITSVSVIAIFAATVSMFILSEGKFVVGEVVQPRYLLPLLPLFVAVATVSNQNFNAFIGAKIRRHVVISLLITTQAISIFTNLKRYVVGLDNPLIINLNANNEWWWLESISPAGIFVMTTVSFGVFVIFLWQTLMSNEQRKI